MRANPFESQLERLARTLTEQFGVQVTCEGENAWTDGRQIVLPSVPEPMDEGLERMMLGYLDHEMAHVAFSDFTVVDEFMQKHPGREGLLNVVEDALIERRAMERWPGVRRNLDLMFRQIRSRLAKLIRQRGLFERFCTAVYLKLAHYRDMLGLEREVAGYEDLLARFPRVRNTAKAAGLAEALLERWLKRHGSQAKPPAQAGCRSDPRQQARGDSSNEDGARPQSDDEPAAVGQEEPGRPEVNPEQEVDPSDTSNQEQGLVPDGSDARSDQPDQPHGQPGPSGTQGADGSPDQADGDHSDDADRCASSESATAGPGAPPGANRSQGSGQGGTLVGDAVREAMAECIREVDGSRDYRVYTRRHDRIGAVADADPGEVQALLATGADTVRRLRRGLTNALRSAEKRWWRDEQLRGELSQRTLYRLCTDRPRLDVFRVRSTVQGKSTAMSIVLDASGSMHTRKMDVARRAVRVLLEALGDLRIAAEAFTFTTGDRVDFQRVLKDTGLDASKLRDRYGRISNLEIGLIKRFEDPVKLALQRLPSIRGTGLTPLGEAMQVGAGRLALRPENRKILLVLTDGKAGCDGGGDAAAAHAKHIAELIGKAGIELVGVGIQDSAMCEIVKDSIVIQELKDLPAQLCKLLGRTLKKGVHHVG